MRGTATDWPYLRADAWTRGLRALPYQRAWAAGAARGAGYLSVAMRGLFTALPTALTLPKLRRLKLVAPMFFCLPRCFRARRRVDVCYTPEGDAADPVARAREPETCSEFAVSHDFIRRILDDQDAPANLRKAYDSLLCQIDCIYSLKALDREARNNAKLAHALLLRVGRSSISFYQDMTTYLRSLEYVGGARVLAADVFLREFLFGDAFHTTIGGVRMHVSGGVVYVVDQPVASSDEARAREAARDLWSAFRADAPVDTELALLPDVGDVTCTVNAEFVSMFLAMLKAPAHLQFGWSYVRDLVAYVVDLKAAPLTSGADEELSEVLLAHVGWCSVYVYRGLCRYLRKLNESSLGAFKSAAAAFAYDFLCSVDAPHASIGNVRLEIRGSEVSVTRSVLAA